MSSQKLSVPYCSWGSTQTPVSASSILENANSYDNEVFGIKRPKRNFQQDSWLEEKFYKALETPLTVMYNRAFPDKAVKRYKAYIYLSPQYTLEQEGEKSFLSHVIFKTGGNSALHCLPTVASFVMILHCYEI